MAERARRILREFEDAETDAERSGRTGIFRVTATVRHEDDVTCAEVVASIIGSELKPASG